MQGVTFSPNFDQIYTSNPLFPPKDVNERNLYINREKSRFLGGMKTSLPLKRPTNVSMHYLVVASAKYCIY